MSTNNEKILVVGGYGFLGQHLVHALLQENAQKGIEREIIIADIDERPQIFPEDFKSKGLQAKTDVDITDLAILDNYFKDVTTVFHLAAIMCYGRRNRKILNQVNIEGSKNVLKASQNNNVKKLIHVSSIGALGYNKKGEILTNEDFETNWDKEKRSYYGLSKKLGEDAILSNSNENLRVVVGMPGIMLGAGDLKSMPLFKMARKWPFLLSPKGGVNYIDVRDVALGLVSLSNKGKNRGRYLLTSNNITHKQLLKEIADHANRQISIPQIPSFIGKMLAPIMGLLEFIMPKSASASKETISKVFEKRYYSNEKAKQELEWEPTYTLKETIEYAVNWLIKEGKIK